VPHAPAADVRSSPRADASCLATEFRLDLIPADRFTDQLIVSGCYNRFARWRCAGVWDRFLTAVSNWGDADVQVIGCTIVPAHRNAVCARNRNGEGFVPCHRKPTIKPITRHIIVIGCRRSRCLISRPAFSEDSSWRLCTENAVSHQD